MIDFKHLSVLTKIAIPAGVIVAVSAGIVWLALSGLDHVAATGADIVDHQAGHLTAVTLLGVAVLGMTLGIGLLGWVAVTQVSRPLAAMAGLTARLARGDLEVEVEGTERRDEIGILARSLQVFKEHALEAKRLAAEQEAGRADKESRARRRKEMRLLFEKRMDDHIAALSSGAKAMEATAQTMSATAEQTHAQSTAVASASAQASNNVQTVAGATDELAASIREIRERVGQSSAIAGKAVEEARRTNETVRALAGSANKIGEVVALIQDIASQTNLLALNATIEAARAGEAGKGFAVVASEVKSLATQTALATEDISTQIGQIQNATKEAVGAIHGIGAIIAEINEIASGIAAAVEEQAAATRDIARNVQEAARGTHDVSRNIADMKQTATGAGEQATRVLDSAAQLTKRTEQLVAEVANFLAKVNAA